MMLFKIIDILNNQPDAKIVVVAPHPHTIRCMNLLKENHICCKLLEEFPPQPENIIYKSFMNGIIYFKEMIG